MEELTYTYALIDSAAHSNTLSTLRTSHPHASWRSLFENTPEAHLVDAAPILISISRDDQSLISWLTELERVAPSVSWIDSRYSMVTLAQMLTSRLNCEIDEGLTVVMRFYDPRILLGLPSALTPQQKRYFFAPAKRWVAWESRRQAYYSIESEPASLVDITRYALKPISLTLAQRDQLMYYDTENLYNSIIEHWEDTCPADAAGLTRPILREIAIAAVSRSSAFGICDASSQHLFAGLMMQLSPSFDEHPMVIACLSDDKIPSSQRMGVLIEALTPDIQQQIRASKRTDALFEVALNRLGTSL